MSNLGRIESANLSGNERFKEGGALTTGDFWRWAYSDLLNNTTRGILGEFIVAKAIDDISSVRAEWDPYDLMTKDGTAMEVKSSAYIQSWHQDKLSTISFGIAPTRAWDASTNTWNDEVRRQAEVYVFCLLDCKDQDVIDPLNLGQWRFYVLPTAVLDETFPDSKSIGLSALMKLAPQAVMFTELDDAVSRAGGAN